MQIWISCCHKSARIASGCAKHSGCAGLISQAYIDFERKWILQSTNTSNRFQSGNRAKMQPRSLPAYLKRLNTNTSSVDTYLQPSACCSRRFSWPSFLSASEPPDPSIQPARVTDDLAFVPASLGAKCRSAPGLCSRAVASSGRDCEWARNRQWHHQPPQVRCSTQIS